MNSSTSDSDRSEEASESPGVEWPDGTQDAMQLVPEWRAHAIPMLATHDFLGVAYSFEVAAEAVHQKLGEQSPDVLYLPLQHLWPHNIELLLKANIQIWSRLEGEVAGPPMGHDLRALFRRFTALSTDMVGDQDRVDTSAAERALESFLALEPQHDASRYPSDRKGRRYERPERVDLHELHRTGRSVSALLSAAYDQADAWLQAMPDDFGY
jgi:hypothetical protein